MSPDDSTRERADESTPARDDTEDADATASSDERTDATATGDASAAETSDTNTAETSDADMAETSDTAETRDVDEPSNDAGTDVTEEDGEPVDEGATGRPGRFGGTADRAVEQFDQRIVDVLSWILDTETRAKIYVHLLANPGSTSEEVAQGTGLYPSTVREALAALHDENRLTREKRASEGAGNNPYEYTAIAPSELVGSVVDQIQAELNTIFNLEAILRREREGEGEDVEPITITIDEADEENGTAE